MSRPESCAPPPDRLLRIRFGLVVVVAGALLLPALALSMPAKLALLELRLELPGVPVESFPIDLDRDSFRDLAVVVASSSWGERAFEEEMKVDEGGAFVDVLTVVPTIFDRRELLVFTGLASGGFATVAQRLELDSTVHAIAPGPSGAPLVAWTDRGIAEIVPGPAKDGGAGTALQLVERVAAATLFAGVSSYIPRAGLAQDVDGDGEVDLLVPVAGGLELFLGSTSGISDVASATLAAPTNFEPTEPPQVAASQPSEDDEQEVRVVRRSSRRSLDVAIPRFVDLNGDRVLDLLYRDPEGDRSRLRGRLQTGRADFGPPFDPLGGARLDDREVVWIGDLDGEPGAELATSREIPNEKDSMRAELAEAKRPRATIEVHAVDARGIWNSQARSKFETEGYVFESGGGSDESQDESDGPGFSLPTGVRDLDGDGKLDLVGIRLEFSLFEAMRIMTTHSIRLGLDFAVYRQGAGMTFRPVPNLDLSGDLRLRLDDVSIGQISSFSGDFDGDGRADFVQLGRGKKVTIHRGQEGARYSAAPDLTVTLEREPADVALVQVTDLDGDGRSDIAVTQPVGGKGIGARAVLELHLSRGANR